MLSVFKYLTPLTLHFVSFESLASLPQTGTPHGLVHSSIYINILPVTNSVLIKVEPISNKLLHHILPVTISVLIKVKTISNKLLHHILPVTISVLIKVKTISNKLLHHHQYSCSISAIWPQRLMFYTRFIMLILEDFRQLKV